MNRTANAAGAGLLTRVWHRVQSFFDSRLEHARVRLGRELRFGATETKSHHAAFTVAQGKREGALGQLHRPPPRVVQNESAADAEVGLALREPIGNRLQ